MTYSQRESSEFDSYPIEIYTFQRDANIWRYTSADEDKDVSGHIYSAIPITRGNIEQTLEMARSSLEVKVSKDAPFCLQFRGSPPTSVINFVLQRYHEGLSEYITTWMGRVVNVRFTEREAELRCEPVYTSIKRPVLRMRYQTTCPHVLYGRACRVDRASYSVSGTVTNNGGSVISASQFALHPNGYFTGGYIDWDTGFDIQRRFILSHTGDQVEINLPFGGILGGDSVVAYPGCDHLLTTCNTKFSNEDNYGGQPFYPGKNPFLGTPIF